MNYTYFPLILWMKLRSQAASPHAIITEVTTALINTVQRQIKTHNALLHPHRDSNQLMTGDVAHSDEAVHEQDDSGEFEMTLSLYI